MLQAEGGRFFYGDGVTSVPDNATTALPFHRGVCFCPGLGWDRRLLSSLYTALVFIQNENNIGNILML